MVDDDKRLRSAKNNAYALLRSRPRSESEMRMRLRLKRYAPAAIDTVISELKRLGQIDDAKFARYWVESRMHSNPAGDVVLRGELKEKGLGEAIIDEVLAEKAKVYDEYSVALSMAEERFSRFAKLDKRKALKRLYDFLYRRGFAYDTVQRVIDSVVGKSQEGMSGDNEY